MPRTRSTTVSASPAAAAETVIATLPGISVAMAQLVDIEASCDITIGTAGVTATFKLERGTVAGGTAIATFGPFTVVAANRYNFTINGQDSFTADVYNQAYVLTATIGSASATSTVNAVYIGALFGP